MFEIECGRGRATKAPHTFVGAAAWGSGLDGDLELNPARAPVQPACASDTRNTNSQMTALQLDVPILVFVLTYVQSPLLVAQPPSCERQRILEEHLYIVKYSKDQPVNS